MQPIRTGLVGYGAAGATFHAPLIAAEPRLQLTRIASSRREAIARAFSEMAIDASPDALIENPAIDLVVIATPNETHYPLALAALRAGKHVVIDKPFAVTVAEAQTLVAQSEQRGLKLSVFHNRRWDGDFLTVADLLQRGVLGSINYVESHFDRFRPAIKPGWREQAKPGSGGFRGLGRAPDRSGAAAVRPAGGDHRRYRDPARAGAGRRLFSCAAALWLTSSRTARFDVGRGARPALHRARLARQPGDHRPRRPGSGPQSRQKTKRQRLGQQRLCFDGHDHACRGTSKLPQATTPASTAAWPPRLPAKATCPWRRARRST
jgi:hypothetical protein